MHLERVSRHGTARLERQGMVVQECVRMPKSIQPADAPLRPVAASCWRWQRQVHEREVPWLVCRVGT